MKLYQNTNPEIVDSNRLTNKMTNNSIFGGGTVSFVNRYCIL